MKTSTKLIALAIGTSVLASQAMARDAVGPGDKDSRWIVGAGVNTSSNLYAGEDDDTSLYPNFRYNGERFFVKDGTLNLHVLQNGAFSYGFTLAPSGTLLSDESEYKDNDKLAGLMEREYTVEGGIYMNHTTDMGRLNLTLGTDLGNEHKGHTALASYTFDLRAGDWYINPRIGVAWMSEHKAQHFFGVSQVEATDSREAYNADSNFNVFAGVRGRYELTDKWDINLETGVVALGDGIKDSSIVDEDYIYNASVGVSYSF